MLLDFARGSIRADGTAAWLGDDGAPDPSRPVHTWVTARMAHVFALGSLLGVEHADADASALLGGLRHRLFDTENGGWLSSIGPGQDDVDGTKQAYAHAFVVLAAATGSVAGCAGAQALLEDALETLSRRFWESEHQLHADEWTRDWAAVDPYRGVNANMHAVEALLAAADATGEAEWFERACAISDRVAGWAQANDWRIPEHFDSAWNVQLDYNADRPRDPFKPFGATPGHGFEWARLLLQVDAAAQTPGARTAAAVALFDRAVADGWDSAHGGFVYTTDWSGRPVEPRRFHWVAAEAVSTADVLHRQTGQPRFSELASTWWEWIATYLVDDARGSWHHELDTANRPSGITWVGKPDVYHAAQAVILPELPVTGSFAASARAAGPILSGL